ncbi:MAG: flagellar basal body P-ring formation protein FlgA [Rhodobacteraceae bacterium]|nr:flagellar basal body P-ring formation protein FlgA [Paracoccaceae bacterium]
MKYLALALCLIGMSASAQTLVATRTVRANTVLAPADLTIVSKQTSGALSALKEAVGQETRVVLYAGRPIKPGQLGAPALVNRNDVVTLVFRTGGLAIVTEGRALGRGGLDDSIQVMNLASRSIVEGQITAAATVSVRSKSGK